MIDYPLARGWVDARLPRVAGSRRHLLEGLGAGEDLKGGEATAPIARATIYAIAESVALPGFEPEVVVRSARTGKSIIALGPAAVETYVGGIRQHADHAHWAGDVLVFHSPASGSRLAVTCDVDSTVVQLFSWGPEGEAVLDRALDRLWADIRSSQEGESRRGRP